MTETKINTTFPGRVNAVFVFYHGVVGTAVITPIVARVLSGQEAQERIRFTGPAIFSKKAVKHITEVVLPLADFIFDMLELDRSNFEIAATNLAAASANDVGLEISGFSADVPVLLAILSAGLEIQVSDNTVFSGHLASPDGDIRMVKGMSAKLKAIVKSGPIETFVHPATASDSSLHDLTPAEKEHIDDALSEAKRVVRMVGISDIGELIREAFSDEQVTLAGLRRGFWGLKMKGCPNDTVTGKAAAYLTKDNQERFWSVLDHQLITGRRSDAGQLLEAFAEFHIQRKKYPKGFGKGLFSVIHSLPPKIRRSKLLFPLIPVTLCIQLSQYAHESENEDVLFLFKNAVGNAFPKPVPADIPNAKQTATDNKDDNPILNAVLSEISADTLTVSVGMPIDSARAAYLLDSVVVDSHEQFRETIASFFLHLLRFTRNILEPVDLDGAGAEGVALLERAFSSQGGYQAALAEARNATNGGLRFVLDLMTEQFKREQQEKHIGHALKSALDPLDWEGKVDLMKALLDQLQSHLPQEITSQPAERYAGNYEGIVKAHVRSMDQVKTIFRSL